MLVVPQFDGSQDDGHLRDLRQACLHLDTAAPWAHLVTSDCPRAEQVGRARLEAALGAATELERRARARPTARGTLGARQLQLTPACVQ